jgi:hypothetical protein
MYDKFHGNKSVLGIVHIVVFFSLLFAFEIAFRIKNRKETPFKVPEEIITTE